jgi:hypothetical protein
MDGSPPENPKPHEDVVLLLGRTDEGHLRGVRRRGDEVALAELRPMKEGQPLNEGDVVSLRQRAESPILWDVEVHYSPPAVAQTHKGPARVTSARYREGWDAIFGREPGELN